MSLTIKSLNRLLDEPDTDAERGEAEYRRGYRDGYSAVINALFELPINVVAIDTDLLTRLFAHWHKRLGTWQNAPLNQHLEPPEIDFQQSDSGCGIFTSSSPPVKKSQPVALNDRNEYPLA